MVTSRDRGGVAVAVDRDAAAWPARAGLVIAVAAWIGVAAALMVTDLWDESRGLVLADRLDFLEIVRTTTLQRPSEDAGTLLFRPLPFVVFASVAELSDDFETIWRAARAVSAGCVLGSAVLLVGAVRRFGRRDALVDLLVVVSVLWSGSGVIAAGWYACLFDSMALLGVASAVALLSRGWGVAAGVALGAAFFCKEVAFVALPVIATLSWVHVVPARVARRALATAGGCAAGYLLLRAAVVAPGSAHDVQQLDAGGVLTALVRWPETAWWQIAAVPVPVVGTLVFVAAVATLRSWRWRLGAASIWIVCSAMYGGMVHLGPAPLLSPDHFIGRLYLVPGALMVMLVAVGGPRWMLAFCLPLVVWGAAVTVERHLEVQLAYARVYATARDLGDPPMRVECRLYDQPFHHHLRGVELGRFDDAPWVLRLDGSLVRRSLPGPSRTGPGARDGGAPRDRGGGSEVD